MTSTSTGPSRADRDQVHLINFDELDELIENHEVLLLLDVRERAEYNRGHIPGALLVPQTQVEAAADPHSPARDDTLVAARAGAVVVYCDNGGRSALAAAALQRAGYAEVYCLGGGLEHLRPDGLVVVAE
jgi:rhodanese-related sulfurtransferase